ncbi:MAG: CBS domain-containing protein [Caldilineaceae bacterium]
MQLKDVMTHNVEVAHVDISVQDAAKLMKKLDVGSLPVGDGSQLIGMVTDRDITIRATAEGRDPKQTKVKDVMTSDLVYCFEDQAPVEAAVVMQEQKIRRLPIVNHAMKLVGIVSLGDLAVDSDKKEVDDDIVGEVLEDISAPAKPKR